MKLLKTIIIFIIVITFCFPLIAEKRKPRKSMKELTDPNSPSYVPFPYPKNKKELIADMKYYFIDLSEGATTSHIDGGTPINDIITKDLFGPNPTYKFGKIVTVKNRASYFPDDYLWLVYVLDSEGDAVMRIVVKASGLVMEDFAIDKTRLQDYPEHTRQSLTRLMKVLDEKDVKNNLSGILGRQIEEKDIKKLDRMGFKSKVGDFLCPLWQFTLKDGSVYIYSEKRNMVYEIDKKITWKKMNKHVRPTIRDLVSHNDYLPDTISDELVTLKPVKKKKK